MTSKEMPLRVVQWTTGNVARPGVVSYADLPTHASRLVPTPAVIRS